MSHIAPLRPSVFDRLSSQLGNVFSKKKPSVSVFERLETNLKDLFQTNVLSFLSPKDVASYLQSHKGSTPTPAMRHRVQRTVFQYRPMSTLKEIREAAVFNGGELIPQSAFKYSLTHLDCSNSDITEEELEKIVRAYPRLINLNLSGCRNIRNISMLKSLSYLQALDLDNTGIQGTTQLSAAIHLLHNNSNATIQDITPLRYLTALKSLHLSGNLIQDITPLQHLTQLEKLTLISNPIQDITPLQHLPHLQQLALGANPNLQDFTPLKRLTGLQILAFVTQANLQDITFLKDLTNLRELAITGCSIQDISPLQHLTKLQILNLMLNFNLQDITPLRHLINLQTLDLRYCKNIQDITPLQDLTQLQVLNLISNNIQDIAVLKKLNKLRELYLDNNLIQDITPLQDLKELQRLDLSCNNIQDIAVLKKLNKLRELYLDNNLIQDITPLKDLKELQTLALSANPLLNITPLHHLIQRPGFKYIGPGQATIRCARCSVAMLSAFDRLETKIAAIAMATFFGGATGGFTAAALVGAYSYLRNRWRAR